MSLSLCAGLKWVLLRSDIHTCVYRQWCIPLLERHFVCAVLGAATHAAKACDGVLCLLQPMTCNSTSACEGQTVGCESCKEAQGVPTYCNCVHCPNQGVTPPLSTCGRPHHWSTFCTQLINSNFRMPLLCSGSCRARGDTAQHDTEKSWDAWCTADLTAAHEEAAPLCARAPTCPQHARATHLLHQLTGFTG